MPTLRDQLDLEEKQLQAGIDKYIETQKDLVNRGRGHETSFGRELIPRMFDAVCKEITRRRDEVKVGRNRRYLVLLGDMPVEVIASLALSVVFDGITTSKRLYEVGTAIGNRIQDEARFSHFRSMREDYYKELLEDFKRKGTQSYRHKHRVLVHAMRRKGVVWDSWSQGDVLRVGVSLVDIIDKSTDAIEIVQGAKVKGKPVPVVRASDILLDAIEHHMEEFEVLKPAFGPTVVQPGEWDGESLYSGGYYSAHLSCRIPMVKMKGSRHRKELKHTSHTTLAKAINLYQNTPFRVNKQMLGILKQAFRANREYGLPSAEKLVVPECPIPKDIPKDSMTPRQQEEFLAWKAEAAAIYTAENERRGKATDLVRAIQMADEYKDYDLIHFVFQADSRSRTYPASAGLQPQGTDHIRALLEFRRGVKINDEGVFWLKVQLANTFGVDKVHINERVAWAEQQEEQILAVAADPLGMWGFVQGADKPYLFIAACLDYAGWKRDGYEHVTHLPAGIDGSCNGLQHLSALGRDDVGGWYTNLIPSDSVQDIYSRVLDVAKEILATRDDELGKQWRNVEMDRKLTKRPVMVLPYGGTERSCASYIMVWMRDNKDKLPWTERVDMYRACNYMKDIVWEAINQTVVEGRKIMDWLQRCAQAVSKYNLPIIYHSPIGFKVFQARMQEKPVQISGTALGDKIYYPSYYKKTDKIHKIKQRNSVVPNLIHMADATHQHITAIKANEIHGIEDFLMIHDEFDTHVNNLGKLSTVTRDEFVNLHTNNDILRNFKDELDAQLPSDVELPEPPAKGVLDLSVVRYSLHFFC